MTPEQKQAFHEARQVVGVIKRGALSLARDVRPHH
jgi:hypothetical protein